MRSLALALLPLILAATANAQRSPGKTRSKAPKHLTFEVDRFESKALKRKVPYGVYLPKGYEKDKKKTYPLVIYLHGMWEDHQRFQSKGGGAILDRLVGDKSLPELVFVCANGGRSSFYINGKRTGRYEDAVGKDLLEHVQRTYRVEKSRDQRAIMGVSMGGWGALKLAFKQPKSFGVVATHSAALLSRDPASLGKDFPWIARRASRLMSSIFGDPTDVKMWQRENPLCLADKLSREKLAGLKIYFDCGTSDNYGFHAPNLELHKVLDKRKIKHVWRTVARGKHGWRSGYNQGQLEHSLRFIGQAWATRRGTKALGGLLGGKNDGDAKKKTGK